MKPIGTEADKAAHVDISKVHGGYFSNPINIADFIRLGVVPIEEGLPKRLKYVDFGGGQGHLAQGVKRHLESEGFEVDTTVVDANEEYLATALGKGLQTNQCNLEECSLSDLDLITMRAVLHYNNSKSQKDILENVFQSLKPEGYFVHQNSSGSKENCELRSLLVNLPELGRSGAGEYHWVSESEYQELIKEVGFLNTVHAGYALANGWSPEEQWNRFNSEQTKRATENNDANTLSDLEHRKKIYLTRSRELILEYINKYGEECLGVKKQLDGSFVINYTYPITVSRK